MRVVHPPCGTNYAEQHLPYSPPRLAATVDESLRTEAAEQMRAADPILLSLPCSRFFFSHSSHHRSHQRAEREWRACTITAARITTALRIGLSISTQISLRYVHVLTFRFLFFLNRFEFPYFQITSEFFHCILVFYFELLLGLRKLSRFYLIASPLLDLYLDVYL